MPHLEGMEVDDATRLLGHLAPAQRSGTIGAMSTADKGRVLDPMMAQGGMSGADMAKVRDLGGAMAQGGPRLLPASAEGVILY